MKFKYFFGYHRKYFLIPPEFFSDFCQKIPPFLPHPRHKDLDPMCWSLFQIWADHIWYPEKKVDPMFWSLFNPRGIINIFKKSSLPWKNRCLSRFRIHLLQLFDILLNGERLIIGRFWKSERHLHWSLEDQCSLVYFYI